MAVLNRTSAENTDDAPGRLRAWLIGVATLAVDVESMCVTFSAPLGFRPRQISCKLRGLRFDGKPRYPFRYRVQFITNRRRISPKER